MMRAILCSAVMSLAWAACGNAPGESGIVGGVDSEARPVDSGWLDSGTRADASPIETPHDFCGLPLMKLPIHGQAGDLTTGIHLDGHRVAYASQPQPLSRPCEVRVMDLEACIEYQITNGAEVNTVWNAGTNVYYEDKRGGDYNVPYRNIYHYDMDTWTDHQITDNQFPELAVQGTEEYLLFMRAEGERITAPMSLVLHFLSTGEERVLAEGWASAGYYDADGDRVAFAAYTNSPQSVGRDVFVHDILRNETVHLDSTYAGSQHWVTLSGDYLAYTVEDWNVEGSLILHHLPSGEETILVGSEAASGAAAMDGRLVAYNTNRYQGEQLMFPSDIELYDNETGELRRVTAEPSNLRAAIISFPYLLLIDWLLDDLLANDYYVAHLVRLGITDETGHILPGEGVILPPR